MKLSDIDNRYQELALKWLDGTITEAEKKEFSDWYNTGQEKPVTLSDNFAANEEELRSRILSNIEQRVLQDEVNRRFRWLRYAAAVLLLMATAGVFLTNRSENEVVLSNETNRQTTNQTEDIQTIGLPKIDITESSVDEVDIPAGKDKAILTLGNGSKIILDDARTGILANQGNLSILKTPGGGLVYTFSSEISTPVKMITDGINYNTIETPKGGKFQVKLPDGSRVWLNAASSLHFPTAFSENKRQVQLIGEAYFEVAEDSSRIFEVITRTQKVQVLGTHFNINAYDDEPTVNTTLLEGSVKISDLRTNASQLLKPGEQAILSENIEVVNIENVEKSIAWKDGYFQFHEADIQTVMRQVGRWYDVDIRYEGKIPKHRFSGEIERSLSLLQILKILEKTHVHFRLEGKEVVVMS